jgi:hypothetical protein
MSRTSRAISLSIAAALTIVLVAADVRAEPRRCPTMPGGSTRLAALDTEARLI